MASASSSAARSVVGSAPSRTTAISARRKSPAWPIAMPGEAVTPGRRPSAGRVAGCFRTDACSPAEAGAQDPAASSFLAPGPPLSRGNMGSVATDPAFSPMPPRIRSPIAASASAASVPVATIVISSPSLAPSAISATGLRTLPSRSPLLIFTSDTNFRAISPIRAAGRAWMPWTSGTTIVRRTVSPSTIAPSASAPAASSRGSSVIIASPTPTSRSVSRRTIVKRSGLVTITGVMTARASQTSRSRSKRISGSPRLTVAPSTTHGLNPRPPSPTVSSPICIRISAPSGVRSVIAWPLAWTLSTTASHGACRQSPVGSTAIPSPIIRSANTGSGTASRGDAQPWRGDVRMMGSMV